MSKRSHTIKVPGSLNLSGSLQLAEELRSLPVADAYILDFEKASWVPPFGLLFLSSEIQQCAQRCEWAEFQLTNIEHMHYAGHMGFFKSFRVDFGKRPGEAPGSPNYVPITLFDCGELEQEAASTFREIGATIEIKAQELAQILAQRDSGDLVDMLTFALREIMRNVIEHSRSSQFGICAQYWPSKETVEVALADRGVGIQKALSQNPHLKIKNDHDALNLALMPGVSGRAYKGAPRQKKGQWGNSGFGLYMTNRLCQNGGNFFIASGDCGLVLKGNRKTYVDYPFTGTALRLSLRTHRLSALQASLEQFREEGLTLAKKFDYGKAVTASVASTMLSRNFSRK